MTDVAIRLTDVAFRWRKDLPCVLDIPAFEVARGEHVFLQGPSGSGKTTLLNLLGGVAVPERGRVEVLGEDVACLGAAARDRFRADHVGFIFQLFNLVPYLSVVDNVLLPCRFSRLRRHRLGPVPEREAAVRLLAQMGIADAGSGARAVSELSVGQQQRVAAARALIGSPEILIADEPTSALDSDRRGAFIDLLFAETARTGATVLFVSHDGALASRFDRVVRLPDVNLAQPEREPA